MTSSRFGPEGRDQGPDADASPAASAVPGSAFRRAGEASDPPPSSTPARSSRRTRSPLRNIVEWVLVVGGALAVALLIKTFLFQAFYIPSESMEPTLQEGDRVLVNKLSYDLHEVNRGDVIVFERPPGEPESEIEDLIKRVVAIPGDTIEGREGGVFLNGTALQEPYLSPWVSTDPFSAVVVPEDTVFVMGDNRGNSRDSRVFGPIGQDLIVGRAFVTVWPVSRVGGL